MGVRELLSYSKKLNVLYVEDEEISQALYAAIFEDIFLKIDIANDGVEAMEFYSANTYDLVISDVCMPRMDGIALSKNILDLNPRQQIIIMSAFNEKEKLAEFKQIGISEVLLKPVQNEQLMRTLEKISKTALEEQNN